MLLYRLYIHRQYTCSGVAWLGRMKMSLLLARSLPRLAPPEQIRKSDSSLLALAQSFISLSSSNKLVDCPIIN